MRKLSLVGLGVLLILIGLGFVFPQLANLRMNGSLLSGQLALFTLGGVVAILGLAGVACAGFAVVKGSASQTK